MKKEDLEKRSMTDLVVLCGKAGIPGYKNISRDNAIEELTTKAGAVKKAKVITVVLICIPIFIAGGIFIYLLLTRGWMLGSQIFSAIFGITGILPLLGIKVNILNIHKRLQDKIFQRIYRNRLS
jgi:hypothetical protein